MSLAQNLRLLCCFPWLDSLVVSFLQPFLKLAGELVIAVLAHRLLVKLKKLGPEAREEGQGLNICSCDLYLEHNEVITGECPSSKPYEILCLHGTKKKYCLNRYGYQIKHEKKINMSRWPESEKLLNLLNNLRKLQYPLKQQHYEKINL